MNAEPFRDREEKVLRLAAQGLSTGEIALELGQKPKDIRDLLSSLYKRSGLKNLHHATAYYGNLMGLRGELLRRTEEVEPGFESEELLIPRGMGFRMGRLHLPACLVSSELHLPSDVRCPVESEMYQPPVEFRGRIDELRRETAERPRPGQQLMYEMKPDNMLVVSRLMGETEFYRQVSLSLRRTGYLTSKAIHENLTRELKLKYQVDPFNVVNAALPLPLAVSLLVIIGDPPHLVVCKRGAHLGSYQGFYTATIDALGEADSDVAIVGGERVFRVENAMLRELVEEWDVASLLPRGSVTPAKLLEEQLKLLALIFDYRVMTFIIAGYLYLREVNPSQVSHLLSSAKEGTYEMLPFPKPRAASRLRELRNLCQHLLHHPWTPCASIGLAVLLTRLFSSRLVGRELEACREFDEECDHEEYAG